MINEFNYCPLHVNPDMDVNTPHITMKELLKLNNEEESYTQSDIRNKLPVWWMELRDGVKPHGYRFWRKTKAGLWEEVATITNTLNIRLVNKWFEDMYEEEVSKYSYAAMKVTTLSGRQIYSTYYRMIYNLLSFLVFKHKMFGISINKGEDYLIFHSTLPGDNLKPIAEYFCKLARQHKGIKSFTKAKFDKEDDYLFWGWLTFNDGHKVSLALDKEFKLFNEYKSNLKSLTISHLTK